jgi:hypothetical protein
MPTRDELIQALRAADAAGDTPAAQAIARRISSMQGQPQKLTGEALRRRTAKVRAQAEGEANRAQIDYQRMQDGPGFGAGAGYSAVQTGQGVKQLANDAVMVGSNDIANVADRVGLRSASDVLRRNVTLPAYDRRQGYQQQTADMRADMEPMQGSIAGQVGNMTGQIAQTVGPGLLLRSLASAPRAGQAASFLTRSRALPVGLQPTANAMSAIANPSTFGGNVAYGIGAGAMQPVASDGERGQNMAMAGAGGGLGAGLPMAGRTIANLTKRSGLSGAEKRAGAELISNNEGSRSLQYTPSQIEGVQRSLGEGTYSSGLMALERNARRDFPKYFDPMDMSNNSVRMSTLRGIAGDEQTMANAIEARAVSTGELRNKAFGEGGAKLSVLAAQEKAMKQAAAKIDAEAERFRMFGLEPPAQQAATPAAINTSKSSLRASLSALAESQAGRSTVRDPINYVIRNLDEAPETMSGLYKVRKTITDLLSGKGGQETQSAKAATRELMQARDIIDAEMSSLAPSWKAYLGEFGAKSRPINRMEIGNEIISRSTGPLNDELGNQMLRPAAFGRTMKILDRVAVKATGFDKARAGDYLLPDDMSKLRAIADDMGRISARTTNRAQSGTATSESQNLRAKVMQRGFLSVAGKTSGVLDEIIKNQQRGSAAATDDMVAYLIANPAQAQRVLSRLGPKERTALQQAMAALGGRVGLLGPLTLNDTAQEP